jgi:LPS export ABC transporter protein LptC
MRSRRSTRRCAGLLAGALLCLPGFAFGERAQGGPQDPVLPGAEAHLDGMTLVVSRAGERELLIEAQRASLHPETHLAVLEGVRSVFEGRPGTPGFEMTCDRGELTTNTNDFLATGHVQGRTADGRNFATDWVRYDPKRGVAYTDAPVQITESGGTYQGGGFRYHVRDQRFRLLGGASLVREQ